MLRNGVINLIKSLLIAHTLPGRIFNPHSKPVNKCAQFGVRRQSRMKNALPHD